MENSHKLTDPDFFKKGLESFSSSLTLKDLMSKYGIEVGSSAYLDIQQGIRCAKIVSEKTYS